MTAQLIPFPKRGPLPPLSDRRTRVLLLAGSYEDVFDETRENTRTGKPQSRALRHHEKLWQLGSYKPFEILTDRLRQHDRNLYRCFWGAHVNRLRPDKASERDAAYHATGWIAKRMPPDIYVPVVFSVAAGYLPSEALAYATKWEQNEDREAS